MTGPGPHQPLDWPVLRSYDAPHSLRVALPLGGIGTGTVSLGGRGDLRDWEVMNTPAKGFAPKSSFFAVRAAPVGAQPGDARIVARALQGPIDPVLYEGPHGSPVPGHGLPRFADSSFRGAYPLGQVQLRDPQVPVSVTLQAFNPLVPADTEASGIPVAVLRYVVRNDSDEALEVSVAGNLQNFIGNDGRTTEAKANQNTARREQFGAGVFATSDGVDADSPRWGSLALVAVGEDDVSLRTRWLHANWGGPLLDFWDDFVADGQVDERGAPHDGPSDIPADAPMASVVAKRVLQPGEQHVFTYLLTWSFPNRQAWRGEARVGNHYATRYSDAWAVAADVAERLPELERRTVRFVQGFLAADVPDVVKEAALFNVSTLRSQTCFRGADGRFFGWEGCNDHTGSCHGNCTHVWNYEQTSPYLFGELARSMRETEFVHATDGDGLMSFRVDLPLDDTNPDGPGGDGVAAADGQMGTIVKLYREWRLSGDEEMLRTLWPKARKALEFAWIPGGWDADRDGVMEGSQHNTMDVEYFGPNPEIGLWYLAALHAASAMAAHVGEDEFAGTCSELFRRGREWLDKFLWNGHYYRHEIRPPKHADAIAPGLRLPNVGARDLENPELQIGDGCLVDQLVGQCLAHSVGLGQLVDPDHEQTTYRSIVRYNTKAGFHDHFNPVRSYALGDETGLVMTSYPFGNRPARPFSYYHEVWPGLEYTAAAGMLQAGLRDEALAVLSATRDRYDGRRRNPFNEAECGHHYVRSMAAWGSVLAWTGFGYDAVTATMRFARADSSKPTRWFWSNGYAWGSVTQRPAESGDVEVELTVEEGEVTLRQLELTGVGAASVGDAAEHLVLRPGEPLVTTIRP